MRQGCFYRSPLRPTIASKCSYLCSLVTLGILFLSWVLTSMFPSSYWFSIKKDREPSYPPAKSFIVARLGAACLLAVVLLLLQSIRDSNLEDIFTALKNAIATGQNMEGIETRSTVAAAASTVEVCTFPLHGWLIEVMETPNACTRIAPCGAIPAMRPFSLFRMALPSWK